MAKRGETRRRIVGVARETFNAERYSRVTTAMLAARLGVSEGNLWYHFKTKRDLLAAIQDELAEESRTRLAELAGIADPTEAYAAFLVTWRDLFARYLFVFRDRGEYGEHSPSMIAAFPALYDVIEAQVTRIFTDLKAAGKVRLDESEIQPLVFNAILITRFYFEFLEERMPEAARSEVGSSDAMLWHLTLLDDRLDPSVAKAIRTALDRPAP